MGSLHYLFLVNCFGFPLYVENDFDFIASFLDNLLLLPSSIFCCCRVHRMGQKDIDKEICVKSKHLKIREYEMITSIDDDNDGH